MNDILREAIRVRLTSGSLRREAVTAVVAGYGTDAHSCAGCGRTLRASEVAYRMHFGSTAAALRMHYDCFVIWDRERVSPDLPATELSGAVTRNSARRMRMHDAAPHEVFRRY